MSALTQAKELHDPREAFAETLVELAREDERVVVVCNDSIGSSKLNAFQEEFPERLVNVGIAEQNMVGVSAGLANAGLVPFVSAAAPFLTGRALEQIKADLAYSGQHVVLCGQSPGMAYGELGPTHHSIEDLSWMRAVANLKVAVPADRRETAAVLRWAYSAPGPVYLRIGRVKVPDSSTEDVVFEPGQATRMADGDDASIIAIGTMVPRALEAAELLGGRGIAVRVLNMASVDPLDEAAVIAAARETGRIVCAEEATLSGGLGAAVASVVVTHAPVPMRLLGIDGAFAPTGGAEFLLDHFGLTAAGIVAAVDSLIAGG